MDRATLTGLVPVVFLAAAWGVSAQRQATLASLIPAAEAIVVAEISSVDYSQSPADGPITAKARVLKPIKGTLGRDASFLFTETSWVGPSYKPGEVRLLFLERATNNWRILSNLYAKADFHVEREAIEGLNGGSLQAVLERLTAPTTSRVLITRDTLK